MINSLHSINIIDLYKMSYKIVFFGDSLSDNGKVCRSTGSGKLWSEIFPSLLRATAVENYARCGANTNHLTEQIDDYRKQTITKNNAFYDLFFQKQETDIVVYSLLIGGNDFLTLNPFYIFQNIENSIKELNQIPDGKNKHFLVFDLPSFSNVPVASNIGGKFLNTITPAASRISKVYHSALPEFLSSSLDFTFSNIGKPTIEVGINLASSILLNVVSFLYSGELDRLVERLELKEYSIAKINLGDFYKNIGTNLTANGFSEDLHCLTSSGCKNGLFYDEIHPSAHSHQLLAEYVADSYNEAF